MKVLSFGEILLRLSAPGYTRLFQKDSLDSSFCGGEANVAVSLSMFGLQSQFLTKLPQSDVGIAAANSMRYFGVDTSKIIYGKGRMGLYYLEKGASQRASKVIYDREYSAIAMADPEDFCWDKIFEDVGWFHWTGINPALSDDLAEICLRACKEAEARNIIVSCDLNFRSNLWSSEKARTIMPNLIQYVDVCIGNEEDAEKVLGIKSENTDVSRGKLNKDGYREVAERISSQFNCKYVAITLRESKSASRNIWSGLLYDAAKKTVHYSSTYDIQIVDRVGSGDSFAAGIIYGLICGMDNQHVVDFATAASCLKHTLEGDYNRVTVQDVEQLMCTGGSGRIQR